MSEADDTAAGNFSPEDAVTPLKLGGFRWTAGT
jgi:hypothetical protein